MIRQATASHAVAPGQRHVDRHVVEAAPHHRERLGDDVVGRRSIGAAAQVALQRLVHLCEDGFEAGATDGIDGRNATRRCVGARSAEPHISPLSVTGTILSSSLRPMADIDDINIVVRSQHTAKGVPMKLGAFFFGGVEMDDAGAGPPSPMDRRYDNRTCWEATLKYVDAAVEADRMGYDSFWTTEHHFQHEGYEVVPNGILLNTWIAARTQQIQLGAMFNVVPQWNPLRLAEDFATMHNLSGGRGILGVGRGTVPREILNLNDFHVSIGSHDNPEQAADDTKNREYFEEQMEI